MMGVWFLSNSAGNKLAGWAAGFFSTVPLSQIFNTVATVTIAAGVVMFLLVRPMRRLMGGVQ
jgi:POT family proton-dependent oligopeptide transporter